MKFITPPLVAFIVAQTIKLALIFTKRGGLNLERVFFSVGMPSSHAALFTALTITIGKYSGFDSGLFALAAIFSLAYLSDVMLVHKLAATKLQILEETIGHSPAEIFVGALIGFAVAQPSYIIARSKFARRK